MSTPAAGAGHILRRPKCTCWNSAPWVDKIAIVLYGVVGQDCMLSPYRRQRHPMPLPSDNKVKKRKLPDSPQEKSDPSSAMTTKTGPSDSKRLDSRTTPMKEAGRSVPSNLPLEVNDDEEVEDFDDQTLNNLSQIQLGDDDNNTGSTTYAGVVQSRTKTWPYCLYIQRTTDRREPISQAHFKAFEKALTSARFKMSVEDNNKLIIEWCAYNHGRGIVAAADAFTAQWVKTFASNFRHGMESTRAWARWERGDAVEIHTFLHGFNWMEPDHTPSACLSRLLAMNGLKGKFEITQWRPTDKKSGVFVIFEPKEDLIGALAPFRVLNGPMCTPKLKRRTRRQRTEAKFLKLSKKGAPAPKNQLGSATSAPKKSSTNHDDDY